MVKRVNLWMLASGIAMCLVGAYLPDGLESTLLVVVGFLFVMVS